MVSLFGSTFASRVTYDAANAVARRPRPNVSNWPLPPGKPPDDSSCCKTEVDYDWWLGKLQFKKRMRNLPKKRGKNMQGNRLIIQLFSVSEELKKKDLREKLYHEYQKNEQCWRRIFPSFWVIRRKNKRKKGENSLQLLPCQMRRR